MSYTNTNAQRAVRRGDSLVGAWCIFTAIMFVAIQGPATINPILLMMNTYDTAIFIKFIVIVIIGVMMSFRIH